MPGWQRWIASHAGDWDFIAVAVDARGPEVVKPWIEAVGFPVLVDRQNALGGHLGAQMVPNGLLVGEFGQIEWYRHGGFSVDRAKDTEAISTWLSGDVVSPTPNTPQMGPHREVFDLHVRLAQLMAHTGDRDGAVEEFRAALTLDPDNFIVRKQIWVLQYPERFVPNIDTHWQQEKLLQERAEEAHCGPDGCAIPGAGQY